MAKGIVRPFETVFSRTHVRKRTEAYARFSTRHSVAMKEQVLRLRILALVVGFCLAGPVSAQVQQIGVTAGLNFDRLTDVSLNDVDANFESKTGWHAEVWIDLSLLGVLTVRPGLRYVDAGALFEGGLTDVIEDVEENFDISLVEVPVLVRFGFPAPVVKPYVLAGPVLRFPVGVDRTIDTDLEALTLAGELGFGVEVPFAGLNLYPEIAFTFGLSSFTKDEIIIDFATFSTDDSQHLNTAMLRLGIGFD